MVHFTTTLYRSLYVLFKVAACMWTPIFFMSYRA